MKGDAMKLDQQYPELANFLGSEFPDADLEGLSDEEVVKRYAFRASPKMRSRVIEKGKALLAEKVFPREEISYEANRYFSDSEDARQWLTMIIQILESTSFYSEPKAK